jgi:tetratricopeptide (TPR) repeat protein
MVPDRRQILDEAEWARSRGRTRRAVKGYRKLLRMDPKDAAIHAKIAPLLAKRHELADAQRSFDYAARDLMARGFLDRALGLYSEAVRWIPRDVAMWETIADLHERRNRRADAVNALAAGAARFDRRRDRPLAIRLLRRSLALDPGNVEVTLALAGQLRQAGERAEAKALLEDLIPRVSGPALREVRAALVRTSPTPGAIWRWLRALISR